MLLSEAINYLVLIILQSKMWMGHLKMLASIHCWSLSTLATNTSAETSNDNKKKTIWDFSLFL